MGRIVSNFFISLDGVVEAPNEWHFPYFDDEMGAVIGAGIATTAAFLMGRVLYGEWSSYWTSQSDPLDAGTAQEETSDSFGAFINNVPKYVVSNTLAEATWNNTTVVSGDVGARLREIKAETDGDIGMSGSATLVQWLLTNGLLDELRLLMHPIVVGHGQRLFTEMATCPLRLLSQQALGSGVLYLSYASADA